MKSLTKQLILKKSINNENQEYKKHTCKIINIMNTFKIKQITRNST